MYAFDAIIIERLHISTLILRYSYQKVKTGLGLKRWFPHTIVERLQRPQQTT
jgi:hypothetical protein